MHRAVGHLDSILFASCKARFAAIPVADSQATQAQIPLAIAQQDPLGTATKSGDGDFAQFLTSRVVNLHFLFRVIDKDVDVQEVVFFRDLLQRGKLISVGRHQHIHP